MTCILLIFILLVTQSFGDVVWHQSSTSSSLIIYSYSTFFGLRNESIFLLGGYYSSTSLIEYNTITNSYTNHANSISFSYQNAQSLAQIGYILYILPYKSQTITAFNLYTLQVDNTLIITYPDSATQGRCLVKYGNYILGIGGWNDNDYTGNMHIYDTLTNTWSVGPTLPTARYRHSCDAVSNQIYIFGGNNGYILDDIWKYECCAGSWTKYNAVLTNPRYDTRTVVFHKTVYIIGGQNTQGVLSDVDAFDSQTNTITSVSSMLSAKDSVAAILIGNIIYVFGGYPTTGNTYYQYGVIATLSPTSAPTPYPTDSPTIPPTASPNPSPTTAPTLSPTNTPTKTPTFSPNRSPSVTPTNVPSSAPSQNPTDAPTISPSVPPTNSPSYNPSDAPSESPSVSPTNVPSQTPSDAPSISPSVSPTNSPSYSPSNAPTYFPTYPPTEAPSFSPTRYPTTSNAYNKKVAVIYEIQKLHEDDVTELNLDVIKTQIIPIIETAYVVNEEKIEYRFFEIIIDDLIPEQTGSTMYTARMSGFVHYRKDNFAGLLSYTSDEDVFIETVKDDLKTYIFQNETVGFYAHIVTDTVYLLDTKSFNMILVVLSGLLTLSVIISVTAFIFNKIESKIDNANWSSILYVGLHSIDLISDIVLSREIVLQFGHNTIKDAPFLYIAGIGSVIFVSIPYLTNIGIVIKIESFVGNNKAASLYFKQYKKIFVLLMLFTGSAHCALRLLSSRIYGLEMFNSGLTQYEVMRLSSVNLFGSVLLENLPQLAVQIIYSMYITKKTGGAPSQITVLSFISSFLSIMAAIISYLLQCKVSDCHIVEYQLEMKKENNSIINNSFDTLSDDEKVAIQKHKECKKKLGKSLAAGLNVEPSSIEFGFVKVTNVGFMVNMVHYVFKSDLWNGHDANKWVYNLYQSKQKEVNNSFTNHFGFEVQIKCKNFNQRITVIELKELNKVKKWSYEGKKMFTLMTRIEILLHENMNTDYIQKQLIDHEGYDKKIVHNILSSYSYLTEKKKRE